MLLLVQRIYPSTEFLLVLLPPCLQGYDVGLSHASWTIYLHKRLAHPAYLVFFPVSIVVDVDDDYDSDEQADTQEEEGAHR